MAAPLDAVAAFLLKYPPAEFAAGELTLQPAVPVAVVALLIGGAITATLLAVRQVQGATAGRRWLLGGLRAAVFVLLGLCLLRPSLVVSRAVPQRNVLAVVLDDSRSMQVNDHAAGSRLAAVRTTFADSSALVRSLRERFTLRFYRLGAGAAPMPGSDGLSGTAARSDMAAALAAVRDALADAPLAGVVLVSDGADNGSGDLERELVALAARGIPVHTVGVGTTRFARDVAVEAIRLPRTVLQGGEAVGDAVVRLRGVGGERAVFTLEAGGRLVHLDTLRLPDDRDLAVIPLRVPALDIGVHRVTARIAPIQGEVVRENNAADAVLTVRRGPEKILHVEGEPRPELPFLRRAAATDSAVQLVSLVRSAKGKYLRLGVDDSLDLMSGFPTTREELFRYRAVVLGSVEAAFFTADQLRMLAEFVSVRGGGMLVLGGRRSLAEGGYAGTAIETVLPVDLGAVSPRGESAPAPLLAVTPTEAGARHQAVALDVTPEATRTQWQALPLVSSVNAPGLPRAGATVLLEGREGERGTPVPLMVTHRYGRGRATVLAVQDAWRWRLNPTLSDTADALRAFWPRVLRSALDAVPDRAGLELIPSIVAPGEAAVIELSLHDAAFVPTDRSPVEVVVYPPDAPDAPITLSPVLGAVGRFRGSIETRSEGAYRITVRSAADSALHADATLLAVGGQGDAGPSERDDALLARLAERTGGGSFDIDAAGGLADAASITRAGITARESNDLWDAPLVLLLLLGALATDWTLRRRWGMG